MRDAGTATTGRAQSIEVDVVSLQRLAATLRDLAQEFAIRDGTLQGMLGDPDLEQALRHAERDWWDQRRRIRTFLAGVADAVSGSADAYGRVEQELVQRHRPRS